MAAVALDVRPPFYRHAFGDSRRSFAVATVDGRRLICDGGRDGNIYVVRSPDNGPRTIEFWAREADPDDEDWPLRSAPWERFVVQFNKPEVLEHEVAA